MQSLQNLKDILFSESKILIQDLNEIETCEALVGEQSTIFSLLEKSAVLKNLDSINENVVAYFTAGKEKHNSEKAEAENHAQQLKEEFWKLLEEKENQIADLQFQLKALTESNRIISDEEKIEIKEVNQVKLPIEDLYISTQNSENIPAEKALAENTVEVQQEDQFKEETVNIDKNEDFRSSDEIEISANEEILNIDKNENFGASTEIEILVQDLEIQKENDEKRRQIVEFEKKTEIAVKQILFEEIRHESAIEKKFRLGKIKGLSVVKSLFDDDLEDLEVSVPEKKTPLQNTNMDSDFMEAEKRKQDFRIDLNDKVAFTKLLFKGDEDELRRTVNQLNSYKTLDEAKEYLSELYYENQWEKVDDYAQRLWVLVENKFI